MGAKEKASALHQSGFNCAQSVLGALGEYTGLDEATALAIAGGFGAGVCCGEICGAVSGAVMALGLIQPNNIPGDTVSRMAVRRLTGEFNKRFRDEFGCIRCAELKHTGHPCSQLIEYAAEQAEGMISEQH